MRSVFGILFGMALLIGCPPTPDPANPSQGSIAPESVEIKNPPAETLFAGAEIRLETEVLPANATDKSLSWTVSPEGTVEVTNGVLTALKEGEATVTVSTSNGKTDSFTVTVSGTVCGKFCLFRYTRIIGKQASRRRRCAENRC